MAEAIGSEPSTEGTPRRSTVRCDGELLSCVRLVPAPDASADGRPAVVFLHGAGTSAKARFTGLMAEAAARGHEALAFDFSGHGESTGTLPELSLRRRFHQARDVIDQHVPNGRGLVLVGFSMSGQTVADLAAHYGGRVAAVGLCAPAVYASAAWPLPFGKGFTEVIRTPDSWRDSPALGVFAGLTLPAVLATPGTDAVIPPAVTEAVAGALQERSRFTRLVLPEADHSLGRWFAREESSRRRFVEALLTGV
ncbi:alpha/beta hydrolase [Streptomyces sp. NPDC006012]|uniref:alpha/beta hydrolase n=1 Tax=Streptomyces sp. NPDC006012 TaxID=3364739 RepID=UPI0036BF022B